MQSAFRFSVLSCAMAGALCSAVRAQSNVELSPKMDAEARLELARRLIEPMVQEATADPESSARLHLTKNMVRIDPEWTANFMLDHPPPANRQHDHEAMRYLCMRPDLLPDDLLLRLLENEQSSQFPHYALLAIRALPHHKSELRQQIFELAKLPRELVPASMYVFNMHTELANRSNDPEFVAATRAQIAQYYESGMAQQVLSETGTGRRSDDNDKLVRLYLYRFAPEEFRARLSDVYGPYLWSVFDDESRSAEEVLAELRGLSKLEFYSKPENPMSSYVMATAGALGHVARFDAQLALEWADQAPTDISGIWGKLNIAAALSRSDVPTAKRLIHESHESLGKVDASDNNHNNSSYPPARLAGIALPLVAAVDPSSLPDWIARTVELAQPLKTSRLSAAPDHWFEIIAAVARYDAEQAQKMFDETADEVELHCVSAFFRALVAVQPELVWNEFQSLPDKGPQGIDVRPRVLNSILPALGSSDDTEFWDNLTRYSTLYIDQRILEPR